MRVLVVGAAGQLGRDVVDVLSELSNLEVLGIERAEHYPRATEHIPEMIRLIQTLLDKALNTLRRIGNLPLYFAQKTQMALAQPCAAVM